MPFHCAEICTDGTKATVGKTVGKKHNGNKLKKVLSYSTSLGISGKKLKKIEPVSFLNVLSEAVKINFTKSQPFSKHLF